MESAITKLSKLKVLAISGNKINTLPPGIGNLKNLRFFFVGLDQRRSGPEMTGRVEKVVKMNTMWAADTHGGSSISALPKEIGKLKKLIGLSVSDGKLNSLPSEIRELKNNLLQIQYLQEVVL